MSLSPLSSCSHLLLFVTVECTDRLCGMTTRGTLTLCELAGSERISKTQATGQRLTEAAAINKSLMALRQVSNIKQHQCSPNADKSTSTLLPVLTFDSYSMKALKQA